MTKALLSHEDDPAGAVRALRGESPVIALVGNPNVGKSTVFMRLTSVDVETAHYPGTTQGVNIADTAAEGRRVVLVDLPGTYSLGGDAPEHVVARRALADLDPDVILVILDATNLERNLVLALEVLDTGIPVVVAANLIDEARHTGAEIEVSVLERCLGVPVVATIASSGMGLDIVVRRALESIASKPSPPTYGASLESRLKPVVKAAEMTGSAMGRLSARGLAIRLFEGAPELVNRHTLGVAAVAAEARIRALEETGESPPVLVSRERHRLAAVMAREALRTVPARPRRRDLWSLTTWPWTGLPLAVLVAASIFGFLFFVGSILATAFSGVWQSVVSPAIVSVIQAFVGEGTLSRVLRWGFDAGIEAALSVGLPYILVFYVLLGILEDTGYLNSLAFLADRFMHRLGLHGRALVPLVAGAGCSVPALVATRSLPTRREQRLASVLVMFVPCSARTAVILGAVGHYVGWQYTLLVMGIVFSLWLTIAFTLQRILPGESTGLVMEMFPFRRPSLRRVLAKSWLQFKEFLFIATPIVVVGSLILGGLYENGMLADVSKPLEPVVGGWLGLPAVAGVTLLMGMLRNELALQLLVVLATTTAGFAGAEITDIMSGSDIVVFALFNTIAFPCISAVAVFWRRNGLLWTIALISFSVLVALALGGILARVLPVLGLQ